MYVFKMSGTSDSSPEDLGRSSEVESATSGLDVASLSQEFEILDYTEHTWMK